MLTYTFPAPDGTYTINLDFVDPFITNAGGRVFDIKLNGVTVQSGFDIAAQTGGALIATRRSFTVTASGGNGIDLELANQSGQPAVLSGIQLLAANPAGIASPTFNVELSTDGASWSPLGPNVGVDSLGNGSFDWSPARFQATISSESRPTMGRIPPIDRISRFSWRRRATATTSMTARHLEMSSPPRSATMPTPARARIRRWRPSRAA